MPQYTLTLKDATVIIIDFDFAAKDINLSRVKAGNTALFRIKQWSVDLIADRLLVTFGRTDTDSEDDPLPLPRNLAANTVINDADNIINIYAQYANNGGAVGIGGLMTNVLLAAYTDQQIWVFDRDGTYVHPVLFDVVATDETAPGANDGQIAITVVESGGNSGEYSYSDDGGQTWSAWATVNPITGLAPGSYLVRSRVVGSIITYYPVEEAVINPAP